MAAFYHHCGNLRLGAEISKLDNDAALAVYASPSANCNDLSLLACTDASAGTGDELLEFDALAPGTYFIRLMNVADANVLNGEFCLFEVVSRLNCADLPAAPAVLVGDCNLPVNVFADYPSTADVPGTCVNETSPSAWVKFEPTVSGLVTVNYLSTSGGPRPGLVVYENPAACGSLPAPLVCQNLTAGQGNDITLSFTVAAGSTYYFNIVNNGAPADMLGSLCVYAGSAPAGTFYTAAPVAIDGTACPLPFNVLSGLRLGTETDNENGLNNAPLVDPGCPAGTPQWDAWASFVITAPLPEPIIIQYDNNNNNGSQADNAALYVYKGENIATLNTNLTDYFREDCNTALSDGTLTAMVLDQKLVGISVVGNTPSVPANPYTGLPCTAGTLREDIWLRYTPAASGPFLVAFSNANQNVGIEVYNGCNTQISNGCANQYADFRDESVVVDGLVGNNYLIRIKNFGGADLTGDVGVFSLIEKIACADILAEGTESITLDASLPGYEVNKTYYIRVANVDNGNSIAGSLCILNEFKIQGDLCSTALGFIEGDCGKNFPITADFKDIQANVDKPACLGAKNIGEDGWAVFTASSNSTTIEYANTDGNDLALAVYRGSCGNDQFTSTLTLVNCADALGTVNGVESIEVNTIPGLQYFVRVMVMAPNTTLTGRICIRETSQTNVCDESEMQTLFVSDCNVRFDVPANFTNDGVNLRDIVGNVFPPHQTGADPPVSPQFVCDIDLNNAGGIPTPARDAWIRLIGTGRVMTLQYQNNSEPGLEASNPALVLYAPLLSVGPLNCGTGINGAGNEEAGNEFACANQFITTNKQTETLSFLSQAGQIYFVRVLDLAPAAPGSRGMTGLMCVSDGDQSYNTCADTLSIEIGDCNVAVNITNGINTFNGPNLPDCEDNDAGANPISGFNDAWVVVKTPTGPLPDDEITIQYDNRTGSLAPVTDIALAIYTITDCNDFGTYTLVGCSDFLKTPAGIAEEGIEAVTFSIDQATGGETYYARIINKSTTNTAFGDVCVFYGTDIAEATCSDASDYGELNGEWRGFEVLGDWTTDRDQPTDEIPPCVIPGGSNPTSFDPPIRSHGWFRFTVPDFEPAIEFVTIQFDNDNFIPGNPENAAIAVYSSPSGVQGVNVNCGAASYNGGGPTGYDPRTFADPSLYINPNGMYFLDCANFVWEGTETLTIPVLENRTYYVRVMNIANRVDPDNMPGRVRVFPFARCVEGPNLIVDETFANWGAMTITGPLTNYSDVNTNLTHPNPRFSRIRMLPVPGNFILPTLLVLPLLMVISAIWLPMARPRRYIIFMAISMGAKTKWLPKVVTR
ncbi:MAG: hypothetical protein HC913_01145 [Microscillaceae bacterium]|nr:hypothetical protein [Microscillaceae bacterium]